MLGSTKMHSRFTTRIDPWFVKGIFTKIDKNFGLSKVRTNLRKSEDICEYPSRLTHIRDRPQRKSKVPGDYRWYEGLTAWFAMVIDIRDFRWQTYEKIMIGVPLRRILIFIHFERHIPVPVVRLQGTEGYLTRGAHCLRSWHWTRGFDIRAVPSGSSSVMSRTRLGTSATSRQCARQRRYLPCSSVWTSAFGISRPNHNRNQCRPFPHWCVLIDPFSLQRRPIRTMAYLNNPLPLASL